jgi:ribosome-binding protein aMBF1 (putative translation factor)
MKLMTDEIRKTIKKKMIDRGLNQTELAKKIKKSRQQVNDALAGRSGHVAETWEGILKELGLKLTVEEERK